ncbi:SCO-spondin-like [Saccostrea cucullata]|uniref:SCO-spondin-like n=1 Tax=Saccostrea cuccullata TaxID=36930 RepID=UPI002ED38567
MDYTCTCTGDWLGQRCTDKNGAWGSWGSYGACSKTCGTGKKTRTRTCDNPAPLGNGATCPGDVSEDADCNTQPCPIDGMWGSWGSWGTCSTTCGGGNQNRTRTCTNPQPQHGGNDCVGNAQDTPQSCSTNPCPIDGEWASWGTWDTCSVTCGGGTQGRNRTCTDPAPQYGGKDCVGSYTDSPRDCNTQVCIIDGSWGSWASWGTCTKTCGGGEWSRSRTCDNPAPANGGKDCVGAMSEFNDCNTAACPTVAAGQYQQMCPSGYFTCETGSMSCIQESFKCDCSSDCDDGSDETEGYAGCPATQAAMCMAENSSCTYAYCPSGWSKYGNNCYKLFTSKKEWSVAGRDCQRYGANLVSVETSGENYFVEGLIGRYTVWTSGSDRNYEGAWAWYSGYGKWSYTKWHRGEPNNCCGGEHCLQIYENRRGWNDLPCNRALAYVCEIHYGTSSCSGWHQRGNRCYRMFGKTNWITALRTCQNNGANLVSIDDSGEQSYIEGLIGGNSVWTSGIDGNKEGYWFFASGTRSWSYTKWNRGEPNNSGGEHCIHVLTNRNGWNDLPCTHTSIYTMCEKPAPRVNGNWGSWGSYGSCTRSCGSGTQTRRRSCNNPAPSNGGSTCPGSSSSSRSCNTHSCAVHGNWGSWGGYGSCTKSCGSGTKTRRRSCNNPAPAHGGRNCGGSSTHTVSCNTHSCPVHGNWGSWGSYGSCTRSCAGGTKTRRRSCNNPAPAHGGNNCGGSSTHTVSCNTHNCPIHGAWGRWGSYGSCTKSCAGGTKTRSRQCNNPTPRYGGNNCPGSSTSSTSCNTHNCPIHGAWGRWGSYGSCTKSCAGGTKTRSRQCNNPTPRYGGNNCPGSSTSSTSCNTHNCPIHGAWGRWGSYGSCTKSCAGGTKTRSRQCNNPTPQYGGNNCPDSSTSSTSCNTHYCPIHGNWASWGSWGSCTVTCGGGKKDRSRTCTNPAPKYLGRDCAGSDADRTDCNTHHCPIDGGWAAWAPWTSCTVTCGGGTKDRSRTCTNPRPQYLGKDCPGSKDSRTTCNTHHCPIDGEWAAWGNWGTCTETCGGGIQTRGRTCTNPAPQYGGANCRDFSSATQRCNTHNCPIDGVWASWGQWDTCTVTCGGGSQGRKRTCTNPAPQYGGAACSGSTDSSQTCNTNPCPIDGVWANWGSWKTCSVTCGGGTQSRDRSCTNPAPQHGGAACPGLSTSSQNCNTQVCIIDGAWTDWSPWGSCSKSCGGGRRSRSRTCDNPKPANGGKDCTGDSGDFGDCNPDDCPTVAAGTYQQLCPSAFFTCQSGAMTCIQKAFVCDCSNDCDDGSDETSGYAGCNVEACLGGAGLNMASFALIMTSLIISVFLTL